MQPWYLEPVSSETFSFNDADVLSLDEGRTAIKTQLNIDGHTEDRESWFIAPGNI